MNFPHLPWFKLALINIYYTGLTMISQTMTPLVLPLLIQQFVGEEKQGEYYGTLRLWTLMTALLIQALMGMLSDASTGRWGKRRPFILVGSLGQIIFIIFIGFSATGSGIPAFWFLFTLTILLLIFANVAHGPLQGLIPDVVPEAQRGAASGIKALFEVPIPLILVAFTIGPLVARGELWTALSVLIFIILIVAAVTMLVDEPRLSAPSVRLDWQPFLRLAAMTALFSLVILTAGWGVRILKEVAGTELPLNWSIIIFGVAGLTAMLSAILFGVMLSIRFALGSSGVGRSGGFPWWVINRLAFLAGSTNLAGFAVFYLQGRLGLDRQSAAGPASILLLLVGVLILLTAVPAGWISDRTGHKPLIVLGGFLASLGVLVVLLFSTLPAIYLGAVLVGAATGLFYTSNWALGTEIVPKEQSGRYLGIANLAGAGAGAVGAYIGGPIADYFTAVYPSLPGIGFVVLFAIYGLLFLFSILAILNVKEIRHKNT